MATPAPSRQTDREIVVSRVVGGPPELVFEVFTQEKHLRQWWGPNGFSLTTSFFEFAPGGEWVFTMHGPDGTDYPNWIRFDEIVLNERIVLTHGSRPDDPDAFISIITFTARPGGTEVILCSVFNTREQRDRVVEEYHAIEGGKQTLGRLAGYVERPAGSEQREEPTT